MRIAYEDSIEARQRAPIELRDRMTNQLSACIPSTASFIIAATLAIAFSTSEARFGARSHSRRKLQPDKAGKDAYTEIQCDWWQTMSVKSDADSSGGLDQDEFLSFLNEISLDHFLVDGDADADAGDSSWQNMFYELAKVNKVEEDSILQVATDGFSQTEDVVDLDPKIQKENEKYRDEFCKSVFEGMLDEGVEVETMDLAIFTHDLFETPSVSVSDNISTTVTATTNTMATATEFVTTNADEDSGDLEENLAASTSNVEDNSTITTLPTIGGNSTILTSPADEENSTTFISQDNSTETTSPNKTSTDESESSSGSSTGSTTATIPSPTTSISFDKISFDESPPTIMTISTATTTASTIHSTTDVTKTAKHFTSSPATTSSYTTAVEKIPESTTTSTSSTLPPFSPEVELASDIEKTIHIATSVEQVVIGSGGESDSDGDNQIPQASPSMIVGVFAGVGSAVVLIVTAVTRHPYFDPSY